MIEFIGIENIKQPYHYNYGKDTQHQFFVPEKIENLHYKGCGEDNSQGRPFIFIIEEHIAVVGIGINYTNQHEIGEAK
ncbi:hypothetical protein D3C87_1757570 [compost metagenome]